MPDWWMNGTASAGGSAASTPTNWITEPLACSALAVEASSGVSLRQGMHHEAKKLSTTGWWRRTPRASSSTGVPPTTEGRVKLGAVDPTGTTPPVCLLYTSDAADEEDSVDLGGRRIIKKKKKKKKHR